MMVLRSKYQTYKYSEYFNVDLPKHWKEKRLGFLADQGRTAFVDGPFGSDLKTSDYKDSGVPLIQLNNIRDSKHLLQNMRFVTEKKKQQLLRHLAVPNDIVIAKMADPVARCTIVSDEYSEYIIVADCVKLTPNKNLVNLSYLVWAINCEYVKVNAELVSTGTTRIRINLGELKKLKIPYPSLDEQQKIANFLDHETTKIDTLIEKQQQLIKLLKEKRQAVISHAVTKGLNPDAPMKDSGVEWLGEVPEHWQSTKLKHIANKIIDAEHKTADYTDTGEFLVCRTTNIKGGQLQLEGGKYTDLETYKRWTERGIPRAGDILFTREAPAGEACVYDGTIPLCLGQRMVLFKLKSIRVDSYFVLHSLYSGLADNFIKQLSQGTTVSHFNMADIKNIPLFEPPINEQIAITKYLKEVAAKYDGLIDSTRLAVNLMQERRTALISAAVTGKIDVRNWKAPASENNSKEATA